MADEDSSDQGSDDTGWGGLALEFSRTFILVRDVFGYLPPGAVLLFLALDAPGHRLLASIDQSGLPAWAVGLAAVVLSYVAGQIVVALGYWLSERIDKGNKAQWDDLATKNHLYYRRLYAELFIESERRDTIAMLRTGLAVALLVGAALYILQIALSPTPFGSGLFSYEGILRGPLLLLAGGFMFRNAGMGRANAAHYRKNAIEVARMVKQGTEPPVK
jgi:hypothetical protein